MTRFCQVLAVIVWAAQWCPRCRQSRHRNAFEEARCDVDVYLDEVVEQLQRVLWA